MTLCQINDMNVVTDGGTIMGIVICPVRMSFLQQSASGDKVILTSAENLNFIPAANSDLAKKGKKVEGDAKRVLPHDSGRMSTGGVEVAEESAVPAGIGLAVILDDCKTGEQPLAAVVQGVTGSYRAQSSSWYVRTDWLAQWDSAPEWESFPRSE